MIGRFNWRLPVYAALATIILSFVVALIDSDGLLYFLLVLPVVSLFLFAFLLNAVIRKNPRLCLTILAVLAVYWALSFALYKDYRTIRDASRWAVWSRTFKTQVLAQPNPLNGEFKHVEWDGWGFAGAGDTTVYLVFDRTNSLAEAAKSGQSGKFDGIPCKIPRVSRLESQWYAVLFYTDERWGIRGKDCGAAD